MLRFGLLHLFESPRGRTESQFYTENIELMEFADDVGLDEIWFAEHHFSDYGVMPSTQIMGSYIAARTKRIRIGTAVVVLPFHNPVRVAEEFAFLDVLSDGRLDFGVGRGYQPGEFAGYGIPFGESRGRFDESLEIIQQAWSKGSVDFKGKHFHFENVTPRPRPVQKPHPPFFGASFNPETIKYQAEKKLNLLFTPLSAPPDKLQEYWDILKSKGEDPNAYRVGGLVFVYVHEDREKALRDFEEPCMWYFRTFTDLIPASKYPAGENYYMSLHDTLKATLASYDRKEMSFETLANEGPFQHAFLVGDPAFVRNKLEGLLKSYEGITDVLCWTRLGGLDQKKVMRSMELFLKEVVAPLREGRAQP